jgi:hypothetical protein
LPVAALLNFADWGSRSNGAKTNDPLHILVLAMFLPTPFELPLWSPHTPQVVRKKTTFTH